MTWNQPSSTSEDPRVARHFLRGRAQPSGTIFIIHSATGRPIKEHSLYEEEKEVLFPTGTQFQVVHHAAGGLKALLEAAMRCSLAHVDVYELRELVLDSWCDVAGYADAAQSTRNRALFDLIRRQPTYPVCRRGGIKAFSSPMSGLLRAEDGATALHLAAAVPDNLPCVQLVCSALQEGDDGGRDGAGRTALEVAVDMAHEDTALFLLQRFKGWDQLSRAQRCKALPWVCAAGDKGLLEALCKAADAEALQQGLLAACAHNQLGCVETLVACGADVRQAQSDGLTALMPASRRGHAACVRALVAHRADAGAAMADGSTALMLAAEHGHVPCIEALIECKADVAAAKGNGSTALHIASHFGHASCVRALSDLNADVEARNRSGWTAVMYAAQSGHLDCIETLAAHRADVGAAAANGRTPLMVASLYGHAACVRALAARAADAGAADRDGRAALHCAVTGAHAACVRALVECRADVGAADDAGQTALMDAAQNGDAECVETLLQRGADPGARHATGQTALMWAALGGHAACVAALVAHSADVGAANGGGWTALMAARCSGAAACLEALGARCGEAAPAAGAPVDGAGDGDGLAAACRHCGARVGVVTQPRLSYHATSVCHSTFVCDSCHRTYAISGGLYHCSCEKRACRVCMGVGGLAGQGVGRPVGGPGSTSVNDGSASTGHDRAA